MCDLHDKLENETAKEQRLMINLINYKSAGNQTEAEENLLWVLRGAETRSLPWHLTCAESGSALSD